MTRGVESDAHTAAQVINWLADFPSTVLTQLATIVIVIIVLAQLLLAREWLQAAVSALAMFAGYGMVWVVSTAISSLNDFTLPMALVSAATSYGSGLLPDIYAGMASFLTAAGPRRTRSTVKWSWNILYAIAAVMVVLSWHSVTGMLVSMAAGRTVGMLIRFVVGTQNKGVWGKDLVAVLSSIGLETTSLIRHQEPGISHGSLSATLDDDLAEGSRIYDVKTANNRRFYRFRHRRANPYRRLSEATLGLGAFYQRVHSTRSFRARRRSASLCHAARPAQYQTARARPLRHRRYGRVRDSGAGCAHHRVARQPEHAYPGGRRSVYAISVRGESPWIYAPTHHA